MHRPPLDSVEESGLRKDVGLPMAPSSLVRPPPPDKLPGCSKGVIDIVGRSVLTLVAPFGTKGHVYRCKQLRVEGEFKKSCMIALIEGLVRCVRRWGGG